MVGLAQVTARYWLSTREHIPREAAEQLVARLAWRGISGWPRASTRALGPREPKGAGAAWTEERRRSDEGRRRLKGARRRVGKILEVKIGVQSVPRELVVETDTPADQIERDLAAALAG